MNEIKIPVPVGQIMERLKKAGYEAYAVGGCVRDTLLGRRPEDWDITTSARPEQVKALFGRTVDTGIQHGTVTVMVGKTGYEVTTYRIDGKYEDGRHPKQVEFTASLLEDLRRRDFTINAMAYSRETGIVDAFGGMEDLNHCVIRCVGNAQERFSEDALRILRAVRFSAQLDFSIEEATWQAVSAIAPNLQKVSRERIQAELTKLLQSDHPEKIGEVYESGIGDWISAEFARLPWRSARLSASLPREKYVRWAAFLRCGGGGEEAASRAVLVLRELKMDNGTIRRVKSLVCLADLSLPAEAEAVRRAMSQMEPEVWDALMVLNEYGEEIRALADEIRSRGDCLTLKDLAVKGQDLIQAGVRPGQEMGELLHQLLDHVLSCPEDNSREKLLRLLP